MYIEKCYKDRNLLFAEKKGKIRKLELEKIFLEWEFSSKRNQLFPTKKFFQGQNIVLISWKTSLRSEKNVRNEIRKSKGKKG